MPAFTIPNIYKPHNLLSLIFISPTFLQPVCWPCRKFSASVVANREVGGGGSLEMRLLVKLPQSHMNINSRPCDPQLCPFSHSKNSLPSIVFSAAACPSPKAEDVAAIYTSLESCPSGLLMHIRLTCTESPLHIHTPSRDWSRIRDL